MSSPRDPYIEAIVAAAPPFDARLRRRLAAILAPRQILTAAVRRRPDLPVAIAAAEAGVSGDG